MMDDRTRAPTIHHRPSPSGKARAPEDQDSLLLRRMADGDESALAALYDRWSQRVHTLALWILKDADEAEDVVEETFWQAWRNAGRFDDRRAAGATWLMMIARSRALDSLRARRRRSERTEAAAASTLLPELAAETTSVEPEMAEEYSHVIEAVRALPPEQREALELAFFGGFSHAEIAARTAQPLGTIKTRIRLAMEKLRQRLRFLREEVL